MSPINTYDGMWTAIHTDNAYGQTWVPQYAPSHLNTLYDINITNDTLGEDLPVMLHGLPSYTTTPVSVAPVCTMVTPSEVTLTLPTDVTASTVK